MFLFCSKLLIDRILGGDFDALEYEWLSYINEKLLTAAVNVKYKDDQWLVISDSAEKASNTFTHKQEAIERAQEIARNKQTKLKIYKQDGTLQETKEYTE